MIVHTVPLAIVSVLSAQCTERWAPGGLSLGFDAPVHCALVWDPDGAGPLSPLLVAGGAFTTAGGALASRIAAWDGTSWRALGQGVDHTVRALGVHDNILYAGGDFVTAGGVPAQRLVRFDGQSWHGVASGLNGPVRALASFDGHLYVGGSFNAAGGPRFLTRWDGAQWSSPGAGVTGDVFAMLPRASDLVVGGNLTNAGGQFASRIARWTGSSWHPMPGLSLVTTRSIIEFDDQLFASGTSIMGLESLQRWTGAGWQVLDCLWGGGWSDLTIYGMTINQGQLILGFDALEGVARWTGTGCASLTTGMVGSSTWVGALASYGDDLFAGGRFAGIGQLGANNGALYDGVAWRPMSDLPVIGLQQDDLVATAVHLPAGGAGNWGPGALAIGGRFSATGPTGVPSRAALLFDGEQWQAMPGLIDGHIWQMRIYDGQLVAAGSMRLATANWQSMARWTGAGWEPWPPAFPLTPITILALTEHQGRLVVGADALGTSVIAWDGNGWQGMGDPGRLQCLLADGPRLFAGGGYVPSSPGFVSEWNGAGWTPLAPWPGVRVSAITMYNGELLAGGFFENPAGAFGIARWNSTQWEWFAPADPELPSRGDIFEMAQRGNHLYIAGSTGWAQFEPMVYRWVGHSWENVAGLEGGWTVWGLLTDQHRATAVGNFRRANGAVSPGVAHLVTSRSECYSNCDCSTFQPLLNVDDFTCFINNYAAATALPHAQQLTHYANCDHSTIAPVLNVDDFTCFINEFAAGCP
jgi:trimeric autotransporter adhesin